MRATSNIFEFCFQLLLIQVPLLWINFPKYCFRIAANLLEIWEMTIHHNSRTWCPCQNLFDGIIFIFSNLRIGSICPVYNKFSRFDSLSNIFDSWSTLDAFMEKKLYILKRLESFGTKSLSLELEAKRDLILGRVLVMCFYINCLI